MSEPIRTMLPWQVMSQNLRENKGPHALPSFWQVPIQPKGGGNVLAVVYGYSKEECETLAKLIVDAANATLEDSRFIPRQEPGGGGY